MGGEADFQQIMQRAGAFRESMVLFTALELDLFSCLEEGPQNITELAGRLSCDGRALEILLDALVAMELIGKTGADYANTDQSQQYLASQSDDYRGAILKHLHHTWSIWGGLTETIKQGKPDIPSESFLFSDPQKNSDYIWGMDNVGRDRAGTIRTVLDLSDCRKMLDLGCGAATYSISFLKKFPNLHSTLFDLPITMQVARENVEKNDLSERVTYCDGDFFKDKIGIDYDLVWISQILHGHDENRCRSLIEKSYMALAPGGQIVIHDFLLNDQKTGPYFAVLFAMHMLAVTESGRCYSDGEFRKWLEETGFINIQTIRVNEQSSLVKGLKPA